MATVTARVLSDESENDTGNEGNEYLENKWGGQRDDSEDDSDISVMERHIVMHPGEQNEIK